MTRRSIIINATRVIISLMIISIFLIQESSWFKESIEKQIKQFFQQKLNTSIDSKLTHISLILGQLELNDITIDPGTKIESQESSNKWQLKAKRARVYFSWLDFLRGKKIRLNIDFHKLNIQTLIDNNNNILLIDDFKTIFSSNSQSTFPVTFKDFRIYDAVLEAHKVDGLKIEAKINVNAQHINGEIKSVVSVNNGYIKKNETVYVSGIEGNIAIGYQKSTLLTLEPDIRAVPSWLDTKIIYLFSGKWEKNNGNFILKTLSNDCCIEKIHVEQTNDEYKIALQGNCQVIILCDLIKKFFNIKKLPIIGGISTFNINSNISKLSDPFNNKFNGTIIILKPTYKNISIDSIDINVEYKFGMLDATALINIGKTQLEAKLFLDSYKRSGYVNIENINDINLFTHKSWQINSGAIRLSTFIDHSNKLYNTNIACIIKNEKIKKNLEISGEIKLRNNKISCVGSINDYPIICKCRVQPEFHIQNFSVQEKNKKEIFSLKQIKYNLLTINLAYSCLELLFPKRFKKFTGDGTFVFNGKITNNKCIGDLTFNKGFITLPSISNSVQNILANIQIDMENKKIVCDKANITLNKGYIDNICTEFFLNKKNNIQANLQINDKKSPSLFGSLTFNNISFIAHQCFIKTDQTETLISGPGQYLVIDDKKKLSGNFILENGSFYLKNSDPSLQEIESLSSLRKQEQIKDNDSINLELIVEIKEPFTLITTSLNADVKGQLKIVHSSTKPQAHGKLELLGGIIQFPYKNLHIKHGQLYFNGSSLFNSNIDIVAKNKVRQFDITMYATGLSNNPQLAFKSSPPLSEEQIVALLLAGSEQSSLTNIAPALLLNNLTSFFTSYLKNKPNVPLVLQKAIGSLEHVRLVPNLKEQQGISKLSGGIEIDINDRLRALIQKDLSIKNDARLELEYKLTDDVLVRGIKDEKGDLGGEVEIRWNH